LQDLYVPPFFLRKKNYNKKKILNKTKTLHVTSNIKNHR
jgi:hypothetical protein